MLEEVRRAAQSGLSYIMIAGLIVIFAFFFGVPAGSCGTDSGSASAPGSRRHVASVAGDDVHTNDLNPIYNRIFGTRDRGEEAQIQRQQAMALKSYLIIQMLAHKAREAGLRVSDQEFQEFMANPATHMTSGETASYLQAPMNVPEFRAAYGNNGTWDGDFYKRYVQNMLRVGLGDYEQFRRDEMLARKYLNLVDMQIGVLPQEVASLEKIRNTELNLEFAKFDPAKLADHVQITDQELAKFVASQQPKIQTYYEDNAADYSSPAQLEVRRIYLESSKEGPKGKSAQERFKLAQKRLDAGEDFAAVAGDINDALKGQQGLMKMTPVENMSQAIVTALEDAKVGDVREIKNDTELMLVKLVDKKKASKTPLADVQQEIARKLVQQQKADALIADLTTKLVEQTKTSGSLSEALTALTPADQADEEATEEADAPAAGEPAADEDSQPAQKSVWSAVTVGETGTFTLEGQDMSGMFGGQLPPGVSLGRAPWDRIPKIGQSRKIAVDAFTKLTQDKPLAEKPYSVKDSKVVVRLKSKKTGAPSQGGNSDATKKADAQDPSDTDDAAPASATADMIAEIRQDKVNNLVGSWERLFAQPSLKYGPWLEKQYKQAVDSGLIKLKTNAGPIVSLIDPNATSAKPAPAGPGSPIEMAPTGKAPKGGSASGSGSGESSK
jgi:hypothetical protein